MIEVDALECPKCKDIIYSRTRHDYHSCSCGAIDIDGGRDYLKWGWMPDIDPKSVKQMKLQIDASNQDLYEDWNKMYNKFGIIKFK